MIARFFDCVREFVYGFDEWYAERIRLFVPAIAIAATIGAAYKLITHTKSDIPIRITVWILLGMYLSPVVHYIYKKMYKD